MKKKYFVGIDLSFTGSAIVLLDDEGKYVCEELISTSPKDTIQNRVYKIANRIKNMFETFSDSDLYVCLEGYALGVRNSRMFDLAELGGYVKYVLLPKDNIISAVITPPTSLKKFITGAGNSKKDVMMKEIYKKYDFDTNNDNIADAYGLAKFGIAFFTKPNNLFAYQKEALAGVKDTFK